MNCPFCDRDVGSSEYYLVDHLLANHSDPKHRYPLYVSRYGWIDCWCGVKCQNHLAWHCHLAHEGGVIEHFLAHSLGLH